MLEKEELVEVKDMTWCCVERRVNTRDGDMEVGGGLRWMGPTQVDDSSSSLEQSKQSKQ